MPCAEPQRTDGVRALRWARWPALAIAASVACSEDAATPAPTPSASASALASLPRLDDSALDAKVQRELSEAQRAIDAAVAAGKRDASLGRDFGEQGRRYDTYGLRDAALVCYGNAQQLAPDDARWPYLQGLLHRERGEIDASVAQLERTLRLRPDYAPAQVALGELHTERGDLDAAEDVLDDALDADPRCAAARLALGLVASARQDWQSAVGHLEEARRLAPAATEMHYPLAMAYRALGDGARAQDFLKRRGSVPVPLPDPLRDGGAPAAAQSDARSLSREANAALQQGRTREAARLFREVVDADPDDVGGRINLAAALAKLGEHDDARAEYEEALRRDPKQPMAHTGLGVLLAVGGDEGKAAESFRGALAVEPDFLEAHLFLADTLAALGRHGEAAEHFARVVQLDPRELRSRYWEALCLVRADRWAEARSAFERACEALPQEPRVANGLARILCCSPIDGLRDGPRALGIAQNLMAADGRAENREVLAMALAEVGRLEEAVPIQRGLAAEAGPDAKPRIEADLALYELGLPCNRAWPDVDPVFGQRLLTADADGR